MRGQRLLHGFEAAAWVFIELAAKRGYDTRIGLEDTLVLPDAPARGTTRNWWLRRDASSSSKSSEAFETGFGLHFEWPCWSSGGHVRSST